MKTDDTSQDTYADDVGAPSPSRERRHGFGARHMLFAGVAGACVLGVGLGLWARPGLAERRGAVPAAQPDAPPADPAAHKLRIVLDDRQAPPATPTDALTAPAGPPGPIATPVAAAFATPPPSPQPQVPPIPAPTPAAETAPLVRVRTPPAQAPAAAPTVAKPTASLPRLTPMMVAALAEMRGVEARLSKPIAPLVRLPQAKPAQLAKAETPPKAAPKPAAKPAHAAQLAKAAADRASQAKAAKLAAAKAAQAHRVELAQAAAAERAQKAEIQKAEIQKAEIQKAEIQKAEIQKAKFEKTRADRLEKKRLAKAQQAETLKLAKAEARGRAEAKAEARAEAVAEAREDARKQIRLASLARVVRQMLPQHPAKPAPVETARNDRRHKGRHEAVVEQASLKARRAPQHAAPPARSAPAPIIPPPHAAGLMKVSTRCASRDPGEALVCADPSLGAADRQLVRAYQGARAAGVPDAQLQRQQERWLQARSAAAREAPWAVHDVYLARIAELNSLAREAHGDGF
ncbi:hypothetical protein [Phenylobacterium sp.]|uniref:hypothetical protein n=1 Tax=Phenylobacterium sp. TaxID=1871053 RepID=UPI00122BB00D|nr:hypothetical protein [Phenylobacterium sp.]THD50946.1 MAG: hypothetical protein E8A12_21700 [Phenylobacterium sp.]